MEEQKQAYSYKLAIAANENIKEKEYWLNELADVPVEPKSGFLYDREGQVSDDVPLELVSFVFTAEQDQRLMKLRNNNDVRLNMILLAGVVLLLSKYTASRDIVVGMPIYKQEQDIEFINTILPIRSRLEGVNNFKELLVQIRGKISAAVDHQNYPFQVLLDQLHLPLQGSQCPLFDMMVILENIHDPAYVRGLSTGITAVFERQDEKVMGKWYYRPANYDLATVERITRHYLQLMDQVLLDVEGEISIISLLNDEERRVIVEQFNVPAHDILRHTTLHQWFEEQVEKTPDHVAVIGAGTNAPVTYRELNTAANQLARRLRQLGAQPGLAIGLLADPSYPMVAGILGILKSGAAYLPIDTDYPDERIEFMMNDSGASILLITTLLKRLSWFHGQILNLDDPQVWSGETDNLEPSSGPGDLAYIIYTSGTTGRPKGVLVEHRQVTAYLEAFFHQFAIDANDVSIHLTSIAFDAFVEEFYPVLLNGGTFGIPGKNDMMDISRLAEFIRQHRVTMIDCTPLMLNEFNRLELNDLESVRIIISGGDVLKPGYVNRLKETGNVYNTYGPTESTVCATYYHYTASSNLENIPIGKPIKNYNLYILDEINQLQPVGVGGEIGVSGAGVTRGYLNRVELTHDRFIPDPVYLRQRMYRSGDRGRWLEDGNIEFLGRVDRQVKIRGYRIEIGEIEKRILEFPRVSQAVVMVREEGDGEKYLCAYVVPADLDEVELRHFLVIRIPDYMIPQFFVRLEQLPLTASGKIDTRALPEPHVAAKAEYMEPRDEVERIIQGIWKEVFGLERIGVKDNFFEIGGHSLKGIQVINGIHKALNVKIGVENIFQYPTIAELAEVVKANKGNGGYVDIEPQPEQDFYELSYAQKRFWILNQLNPDSVAFNMFSCIDFNEILDIRVVEKAFKTMIQRHESFRTAFREIEGHIVQVIEQDVWFEVAVVDCRELSREEARARSQEVLNREKKKPFSLNKAPLLRVIMIKHLDYTQLAISTHHLVTDGGSVGIFIRELYYLLGILRQGIEPVLEPLRIQYKDFAYWQNRLLENDEGMKRAKSFWQGQLSGELPVLPLPYDFAPDQLQTRDSQGYRYVIPVEIKDLLLSVARAHNTTLFVVMLAGVNLLFSFYSGQPDIIIGSPGQARQHEDLKNIIGLFANTLIFRAYIDRQEIFTDFLKHLHDETLNVIEYQSYPLELICDNLGIQFPKVPVFFNMLNMGDSNRVEMGNDRDIHTRDTIDAKADLSFYVSEYLDGIEIFCQYCLELFKPGKIEKMVKTFAGILEKIAEDPTLPLGKYKVKAGRPV